MTLNTKNPNFDIDWFGLSINLYTYCTAKCCSYHGNRMLLSGYVQDFPDFDIIRLISLIIEYIFKKEVILLDILRQKFHLHCRI